MKNSQRHLESKETDMCFLIVRFLCILYILLIIPASHLIPVEYFFENSIFENLQVSFLLIGTFFNLYTASLYIGKSSQIVIFHRTIAALLLLLCMRELSYGRVFFPIGIDSMGAYEFIPMEDFALRLPIYIFLTAYMMLLLKILAVDFPWALVLNPSLPPALLWYALLILSCIVLSIIGDHHYIFDNSVSMGIEEMSELLMYFLLLGISVRYSKVWQCG